MHPDNLLIADQEPRMLSLLGELFGGAGYAVHTTARGEQAIQIAVKEQPTLMLLDLALNGAVNGYEVIRRVRQFSDLPIIILSRDTESDSILRAYDLGVDDYVIKPFDPKVLLARTRAVLKRCRAGSLSPAEIVINNMVINLPARQVKMNGVEVYLTATEFNLLLELAHHRNCVLTHDQLLVSVWGEGFREEVSYLRSFIHILRRKLEMDPSQPQMLISRPGIGYMLAAAQNSYPGKDHAK